MSDQPDKVYTSWDIGQKDDACVLFSRRGEDGSIHVLDSLQGDAAREFVRTVESHRADLDRVFDAALEAAAEVASNTDAKHMRQTYKIEHNRKRYDVNGVERCEDMVANVIAEDATAAIRALKSNAALRAQITKGTTDE